MVGCPLSTVPGKLYSAGLRGYTGGFSKKVRSLLHDLLESEEAAQAALSATEWTWLAVGLPAYFQQAISFGIVIMTALSVQNGFRREHSGGSDLKAKASWLGLRVIFRLPFNGAQTDSAFANPSS